MQNVFLFLSFFRVEYICEWRATVTSLAAMCVLFFLIFYLSISPFFRNIFQWIRCGWQIFFLFFFFWLVLGGGYEWMYDARAYTKSATKKGRIIISKNIECARAHLSNGNNIALTCNTVPRTIFDGVRTTCECYCELRQTKQHNWIGFIDSHKNTDNTETINSQHFSFQWKSTWAIL